MDITKMVMRHAFQITYYVFLKMANHIHRSQTQDNEVFPIMIIGHNHHDHGSNSNREGRDLDCYCVPTEQCPSTSIMNPFGLTSNHIQHGNHHHNSNSNSQFQNGNNHISNGRLDGQRPAREQLPDTPIKDYSSLINPRVLPKDIVAVASINKGDGEDHDTLDLSEDATFENNRARYFRKHRSDVYLIFPLE